MSREKQIDMVKVLCDGYGTKCGGCGCKPCAIIEHCKELYNAGYRKQKEGEWKFNEERDSFVCSLCGGEALLDAHFIGLDYGIEVLSDYCPNCGAKMKGGAE